MQVTGDYVMKGSAHDPFGDDRDWGPPPAPGIWEGQGSSSSSTSQTYADTRPSEASLGSEAADAPQSSASMSSNFRSSASQVSSSGADNDNSHSKGSEGKGRWQRGAKQYRGQRKDQIEASESNNPVTTMMIRNIPKRYVSQMLAQELNVLGFKGKFDFVYIPIDPSTGWSVGYGFVNFVNSAISEECVRKLTGYRFCRCKEEQRKPIDVVPAHLQGLRMNLEHYCRTAVQFKDYRPMIIPEAFGDLPTHEKMKLYLEFGHLFQEINPFSTTPSTLHSHNTIPKHRDFQEESDVKADDNVITTLMIRNIPKSYTNQNIVGKLNELGLRRMFDFVYVPIDQSTSFNVGYAFVNFISAEAASECVRVLKGLKINKSSGLQHRKYIDVIPAHMQGLYKNLEYYRCTAVQFNNVKGQRPLINAEGLEHLSDPERQQLRNVFGHLIAAPEEG